MGEFVGALIVLLRTGETTGRLQGSPHETENRTLRAIRMAAPG